jgi:hypothetical protein
MKNARRPDRRLGGEAGVTLSELVIAVAILGLVMVVLAGAFIVSERTHVATATRFKESHDTQIASAYLANDVQSATDLTSTVCGGGSSLVNFNYPDGSLASYVTNSDGLNRTYCTGGNVVANARLVQFAGATPVASCKTSSWNPCNPSTTPRPNKVRIQVNEGSGYAFSVSGSRRIAANPGSITSTSEYPPLLALGSSGLQVGTNGNHVTFKVNGKIIVNSDGDPAVSSGSSNFSYGSMEIYGDGTCSGCPTGYTNRVSRVVDPLSGLPVPSTAGLPVDPPKVGTTYSPGIYTTPFNPDGTLSPGIYILQAGLNMAGQSKAVGNGVLLYITGGTSCTGGGSFCITGQAQLNVSAPTSGTYANLVIWQDKTDSSPFLIAGNGAFSDGSATTIMGTIYLPTTTQVTLGTGNGQLAVGSVIAPNIVAGGNGSVCIGFTTLPC